MANPQRDFTRIPNELLDALYKTDLNIAPDCRKIFDMIIRQTYGYNRPWAAIKNVEFSRQTGIKMPNVSRAIKKLQLMNLIVIRIDNFNDVNYCIQTNCAKWKKLSKQITVIQTDNKQLSKQITSTPSQPFSDNGSGDPKDSIKEKNIYTSKFAEIWKRYPQKLGKKEAIRHFKASVKKEQDWRDINKALDKYLNHLKENTWKKPQHGSTWFNNWRDWLEYEENRYEGGVSVR